MRCLKRTMTKKKKMRLVSRKGFKRWILFLTIDTDMAISMSFVRRAQKMSLVELEDKITGLNRSTLRRYMQQSYLCMRPIHVVAAVSWVRWSQ